MSVASSEIRVRYGETDQMGVAYYGHYLTWFEVGRSDVLRELGLSYRELEQGEVFLPVVEAECRYLKPARYDDQLRVTTQLIRPGRRKIRFEYEVHRLPDQTLLASGSTVHVAIGKEERPRSIPDRFLRRLTRDTHPPRAPQEPSPRGRRFAPGAL
jgi:acyl-CoA thioester hydrolase